MNILYAALVALPLLSAVPAFATNGADAIRDCEGRKGCTVIRDNSGGDVIVIVVGDTTIVCPSEQDDCFVWTRVGGTRLPHVNVDAVLAEPGRSGAGGKPQVAPRSGGLTLLR